MQTIRWTFAAGESQWFPGGNFFQFLRGDDEITVEFWHGGNLLESERAEHARPGYKAEPKLEATTDRGEVEAFTAVKVTSATAQTVDLGISHGEGGYNRFTGDVDITGPIDADGHVETADAKSKAVLNSILSMLQNADDQRAPLTYMGDSYIEVTGGGDNTFVSGASNTNGVVVRVVVLHGDTAGNAAEFYIGANRTLHVQAGSTEIGVTQSLRDLFVPAGNSLRIKCNSGFHGHIWYEVL